MLKNTPETYGTVAKFLHWAIFVLILCMLVAGYTLGYLPKSFQGFVWNIHKVTGLTILTLMVLRLLWALTNPKPVLPAGTLYIEKIAEHVVHYSLYLVVISMPIAAWIAVSSAGRPPRIGSLQFALPIQKDEVLIEAAFHVHDTLALVLISLIVVHLSAALFHHFVRKDNVLRRMMPQR